MNFKIKQHGTFIINNKRGFGYWLWKPFLILYTMKKMKEGDILLFLDAGCEIDTRKSHLLQYYFDALINSENPHQKIMCTFTCKEKEWNKMDLIAYLNMHNEIHHLESAQHASGVIMLQVTNYTLTFVQQWYQICCKNNYHYITDAPSKIKNYPSFKEHRHDQSVLSLLSKKMDIILKEYDLRDKEKSCILTLRNRTGKTRLPA